MTEIAKPSVQSLLMQMYVNGNFLSSGTGFMVSNAKKESFFITNRHNVTGRNQYTGQPISPTGGLPDQIVIYQNKANQLGHWTPRVENLYTSDNAKIWYEHPTLKERADFVALRLSQLDGVDLYPYDLYDPVTNVRVGPSDYVSVIGFPFGLTAGGAAGIWATGFMASEPDVKYENLPIFLIDCRTRPGQSGSPVIAYRSGGTVIMADGSVKTSAKPACKLLGIYSGRINNDSDLGIVWKTSAIKELIDSVNKQ